MIFPEAFQVVLSFIGLQETVSKIMFAIRLVRLQPFSYSEPLPRNRALVEAKYGYRCSGAKRMMARDHQ
jgi:hypothetical protein